MNFLKSQKIDHLSNQIQTWKTKSLYLRLDELLWEIMLETGYFAYVGAMPGGKSRQANLRLLIDRAEQMEKTSVSGLFNFIQVIDKMKEAKSALILAKMTSNRAKELTILFAEQRKLDEPER